jgi:hypothetical protein
MNSPFKFPRRVRIHGGECGAVARALHHEAQKVALTRNEQTLISDECSLTRQAGSEKASGSTLNERKQMSTKTSIKRIALVAVSALGLSLANTAPSFAGDVNSPTANTVSINLKLVTAAPKTGTAVEVNFGADTTAYDPGAADKAVWTVTGYLSTYPSGGFAQVTADDDAVGTDVIPTGSNAANETVSGSTYTAKSVNNDDDLLGNDVTATTATGLGSFSFNPSKAGDYTLTVWNDRDIDGSIDIGEAVQTLVITVVDKPAFSNSLSTAYIIAGNGTTRATATTDAEGYVFASKTMSTANAAAIAVALVDSTGTAMTSGNTLTATITGVGGVVASASNQAATQCNASTVTRVSSVTSDGEDVVYVCADGNAGVGTITIQVTNAAGVTTTLATKTVTFYGAVTGISTVSTLRSIGRAGGYTAGAADGSLAGRLGTEATTPAFIVKTVDATGGVANIASAGVPEIISSDLTVVTGGTCALDDGLSIYSSGLGAGFYNCNFDTAVTSASGQKATLTVRTANPAVANTYFTTTVDVTIGGSVSTTTLTFDKASYEPGEAMVVTLTAKDSAGNPVYDGAATPEVSFNKAVGGASQTIAASVYVAGKYATSSTRPSIFAPSIAGDFFARASAAVGGVTSQLTTKATVTQTGTAAEATAKAAEAAANAASDAAAEAIDAANAATDAANLAAEAADAATVAAEEARDAADAATAAVEELATQVATLMAALKAQITTLANTVAKIAKKVKA